MIEYIIPLIASWLPVWNEYLVFYFAGSFIALVGAILHFFFRR